MYFQSFDFFHIALASFLLLTTGWVVLFQYKKHYLTRGETANYVTNIRLIAVRLISLFLCVTFLSVALLSPVGFMKGSSGNSQGIDCIWILDVSMSMDAEDITEDTHITSRLTRAKSVIENSIITHPENRYGLVIFSGKSRLISPLTSEHSSLLSFLASIDSKSISEGGTDFQEALSLAIERFDTKDATPHTMVLLSDGGDREDSLDIGSIRDIFLDKHTNLITMGFGKTKPSPIPVGRNPLGDTVYKQFQGAEVLTGLNRENLKNLAEIGKGSYLEGASIETNLEKSFNTLSRHTLPDSEDGSGDISVWMLMMMSFFFLLIFFLFPSSFLKRGNAL